MTRRFLLVLPVVVLLAGCSPKLSPLYRDYAVPPADTASATAQAAPSIQEETVLTESALTESAPVSGDPEVLAQIRRALESDGWTLVEDAGAALVETEPRRISEWGLYHVAASLEVVPLGPEYVRVLVHPYRVYITGGRTKIPFLQKRMRRVVMPRVSEALAAEGLIPARTAIERDERAVD